MNFDIKDYRQPLVTSLGIIIGFLAGTLGQWVTEDNFALNNLSDRVTFTGIVIGLILLFSALFRMLIPITDSTKAYSIYMMVLKIYACGLIIPLASLIGGAFL